MSRACKCRYCAQTTAAPVVEESIVHEPVELPAEPRLFRVHNHGLLPQDCTLHPDGRLTMQAAGQTLRSWLSFDEMRERNWATAHIEWDPEPLADEAEPEPEAVQAAIPLDAS